MPEKSYGMAPRFKLGAGLKPKGGPSRAGTPRGYRVQDRVGVQAPAGTIWRLVYDVGRWSEWNPLYPKVDGQIRIGGSLSLTKSLPGRTPRTLQARVLEWVPEEQLHWRVAELAGLAVTTAYIEIESLAEAACIVSSGELVGGFLAPFVLHPGPLRRGLRAMNLALKEAAEAEWRAAQG